MIERDATKGPDTSVAAQEFKSVCSYEGGKVVLRSKGMSTPTRSGASSYEPPPDSESRLWSGRRLD
jgi:hypothetical protein